MLVVGTLLLNPLQDCNRSVHAHSLQIINVIWPEDGMSYRNDRIMEYKRNDATQNRPEGNRVLDAEFVFMDLPAFIRQLKEEVVFEKNDRNGITVFKTEHLTITLTILKDKVVINDNLVSGLFTLHVIEGSIRFSTVEG